MWPSRPVITGSIKVIYHRRPPPTPGGVDSVAAGLPVTSEGEQRHKKERDTQTRAQDATFDQLALC